MTLMKILIFEFITGGGLNKTALPDALAQEGLLMVQALLDNLAELHATVDCHIMLDDRLLDHISYKPATAHLIHAEQNSRQIFIEWVEQCDAIWLIAPESDGILYNLCQIVEQKGKRLLTSSSAGVALAGNKWLTFLRLQDYSIATVPTYRLDEYSHNSQGQWLIKPIDGVSCEDSYLVNNHNEFTTLTKKLDHQKYIIQPHILGNKTSLSCLFQQGKAWLICVNQQNFQIINKQYHLTSINVNIPCNTTIYQQLANKIAHAMPELWGYVGIDLIETPEQPVTLEINPRLTTSFAGIQRATGINCVQQVLKLLTGEPLLFKAINKTICIKISG